VPAWVQGSRGAPAGEAGPCPSTNPHGLRPKVETPARTGLLARERRLRDHAAGWHQATRTAGVEGLRFHDLRHSAATLALAAGANIRELMERMGTPRRRWPCATSM
jgi:hypothetical protein